MFSLSFKKRLTREQSENKHSITQNLSLFTYFVVPLGNFPMGNSGPADSRKVNCDRVALHNSNDAQSDRSYIHVLCDFSFLFFLYFRSFFDLFSPQNRPDITFDWALKIKYLSTYPHRPGIFFFSICSYLSLFVSFHCFFVQSFFKVVL